MIVSNSFISHSLQEHASNCTELCEFVQDRSKANKFKAFFNELSPEVQQQYKDTAVLLPTVIHIWLVLQPSTMPWVHVCLQMFSRILKARRAAELRSQLSSTRSQQLHSVISINVEVDHFACAILFESLRSDL